MIEITVRTDEEEVTVSLLNDMANRQRMTLRDIAKATQSSLDGMERGNKPSQDLYQLFNFYLEMERQVDLLSAQSLRFLSQSDHDLAYKSPPSKVTIVVKVRDKESRRLT